MKQQNDAARDLWSQIFERATADLDAALHAPDEEENMCKYFPKGTDFNEVSDEQIKQVMYRLNNRPGKTRGGRSPNELFMGQQADLLDA